MGGEITFASPILYMGIRWLSVHEIFQNFS
jgi:hypothetical protein